ncbi:MAG: NAD-binding protein [Desulfatiglans sp.]|jgi:voltage-gated potassium channel|nr:NAD-binding protein [Desulfatiglans sp.]
MSSKGKTIVALLFCMSTVVIGTLGYEIIEGYSLMEAVYMSVITITTVGFGEVKPLSETGRVFTTLFILLGFGSLAFTGHVVVESLMERVWSGHSEIRKMKKKISQLKSHFIICGVGRVGAAAVEYFSKMGSPCVMIETNSEQCQEMKERGFFCIEGDATRETTLLDAGIKSASGLLALLNSDPENLFIVLTARELNPTLQIIARAEDSSSERKTLRAGADSVISPFATAGKQIAQDMLEVAGKSPGPKECVSPTNVAPLWVSIQPGSSMQGETVKLVSEEMGRQIIGLRRNGNDLILPPPETVLEKGDRLLVIDEREQHRDETSQPLTNEPLKVVIVDDNPVILRLYTRLFQKAGFYPITARDGREGLDTIIRERPAAAVIDFMLPVFSGIEVCRRLREKPEHAGAKLILFTSDNRAGTREEALKAGADEVVVKSAEAYDLITTVTKIVGGKKS